MQNEKLHLTQALRDITQVVLRIGTSKAESGANLTYVIFYSFFLYGDDQLNILLQERQNFFSIQWIPFNHIVVYKKKTDEHDY